MKANLASANFRVWGPDETASNRLDAIYEVSPKVFMEHCSTSTKTSAKPAG